MKLTFICKTDNSNSGNCPALYATDRASHVVQGRRIDDDTVEVPADIAARIAGIAVTPTTAGTYLVRGLALDTETRANLRDRATDEDGVEVIGATITKA